MVSRVVKEKQFWVFLSPLKRGSVACILVWLKRGSFVRLLVWLKRGSFGWLLS